MRNLIGIEDKVVVKLKGEGRENIQGNGEIVIISQVSKINNEIYYTGEYTIICPVTKVENTFSIQFKEGEYEIIEIAGEEF